MEHSLRRRLHEMAAPSIPRPRKVSISVSLSDPDPSKLVKPEQMEIWTSFRLHRFASRRSDFQMESSGGL